MKRYFDILLALFCLVTLLPVLLFLASFVWIRLGSPVLFRQSRPGLYGKPFTIYKFRTMSEGGEVAENLLPDEQRVTSFGMFMRNCSLDELPELYNVIKGDMSLVGPRPLLMEYLDLYTPEQARRHEVRPGITGWAQVNGRNVITWEEKFRLDVWYIDNHSFILDMKILFMTVAKVFKRENINREGRASAEKFKGSSAS